MNRVTVELFKKYRTAEDYASEPLPKLQSQISKINFYRNKADRFITAAAKSSSASMAESPTGWRTFLASRA